MKVYCSEFGCSNCRKSLFNKEYGVCRLGRVYLASFSYKGDKEGTNVMCVVRHQEQHMKGELNG